jgi:protoheme IX farnesyltransferase
MSSHVTRHPISGIRLTRISEYFSLTKPGLTATSVATAVCASFLASRGVDAASAIPYHVLVGSGLLGGGAIALNQVIERDRDRAMKRTVRRPIASGRISPFSGAMFGGALALAGLIHLFAFTNPLAALLGVCALSVYLFVYTPLKTVTPFSTLIGAVAGALPPVIGWTAVDGRMSLEAGMMFAILFFWQIPHFLALAWMYREDYEKGGYRFLPAIDREGFLTASQMILYAVALLVASLIPYIVGTAGHWYLGGAIILSGGYIIRCVQFLSSRSAAGARLVFRWSLLYLPILATLILLDLK